MSLILDVVEVSVHGAALAPVWRVGDPVMVSRTGSWYPEKILDARNGQYRIRYDG